MTSPIAAAIVLMIGAINVAHAQSAVDELQPLVNLSARRLALAEQVARAKWDSHAVVEDAPREAQVIAAAVREGQSKGLESTFVANFFRAQIEASKIVQYSLLAEWHRAASAPTQASLDVLAALRPRFDALQEDLLQELARTRALRGTATCQADVAKAVARYLMARQQRPGALLGVALDRALAATCTG